ncbi:hypothetical protein NC653_030784 [Populus alba x Populus x berolinensis]|uniref:Uncharacterized protein n=1 Tax=Populus alba x Populus x berolinensis TaxID=444605 RepID=A0AAD6LWW9_9ROSI|nr:hypothetical protein NC653_030784 [Populus alba x Populus x berolinensis]
MMEWAGNWRRWFRCPESCFWLRVYFCREMLSGSNFNSARLTITIESEHDFDASA